MIDYELLSEVQFKARYLEWRHKNDNTMIMPEQTSYEEYAEVVAGTMAKHYANSEIDIGWHSFDDGERIYFQ